MSGENVKKWLNRGRDEVKRNTETLAHMEERRMGGLSGMIKC